MLQRYCLVGEFFRLSPPEVWDTTMELPPSYMGAPLHFQHVPVALP